MRLLILLALLPLFTACSTINVQRMPSADLSHYRRFFVQNRLNDNHAIDELIAAELRARGYDASSGPLTMMPDNTQILIDYDARWTWDFHSYLVDLSITARKAYADTILATGTFHHPGLTPKSPETMVSSLLDGFFEK